MAKRRQPGDLTWDLIDPVWDSVGIYDGPRVFLRQFRELRPELGHLLAAHWFQSEINNGGLLQFFANSTGVLAPEAFEGLRAIGLKDWARILKRSMRMLGEPYPRARSIRQKAITLLKKQKEKRNPFDLLDVRFFDSADAKIDRWENAADKYARRIKD